MAIKTDNFPLFACPRRKVTGLSPQQMYLRREQLVEDCGKILQEVKIDCAISAANSRLRARANDWLFFSRLWGLRPSVSFRQFRAHRQVGHGHLSSHGWTYFWSLSRFRTAASQRAFSDGTSSRFLAQFEMARDERSTRRRRAREGPPARRARL